MSNPNETIVDKAVNLVKDALGIEHNETPEVVADPKYHDTEPEEAADAAMSFNPNAFVVNSAGQVDPATEVLPVTETDDERLRREADERSRPPAATDLNDIVRRENGV